MTLNDDRIRSLIFHELNAPPSEPAPMQLDDSMYKVDLSKAATLFHRSFLDVTGIEDQESVGNGAPRAGNLAG